MKNGQRNAKQPPAEFWDVVSRELEPAGLIQIGRSGEIVPCTGDVRVDLPLHEIERLVQACDIWVSPDSYLQHVAHHYGKRGVVIWSVSDPTIFGYKENINLLKSREFLRKDQFDIWESQPYNLDAFVNPLEVVVAVQEVLGWL